MVRRKPPTKRRKKSNVINLEEYCLKRINEESYLSRDFFYEHLDDIIKSEGGYGTKESLANILEYMNLYHTRLVIAQSELI